MAGPGPGAPAWPAPAAATGEGGAAAFAFAYPDALRPEATIRESLCVDQGSFVWTLAAEDASSLDSGGGQWCAADVAGVRYATKRGNPSLEHASSTELLVMRRRALAARIRGRCVSLKLVVNPLAPLMCLLFAMTGSLWQVFPRAAGTYTSYPRPGYNMSAPANDSALGWAAAFAALACPAAVCAGWWLLSAPRPAGHASPGLAPKWSRQRLLGRAVIVVMPVWCAAVVVLCPLAGAAGAVEVCASSTDDGSYHSGRRVSSEAGGERSASCYTREGAALVCGVGGCGCTPASDLACATPPEPPGAICQTHRRPLCATPDSAVELSGWHAPLLALACTSSVLAGISLLLWAAMLCSMLLARASAEGWPEERGGVAYHRFAVSFREPSARGLVFTLGGGADPSLVAALLLAAAPAGA